MLTGGRQAHRTLDTLLLIMCLGALGIAVLYPTLRLAVRAFAAWDWGAVLHGAGLRSTLNTFWMSLASVAGAGVVGTGMALLLGRYEFPGRRVLGGLAYLPFTLPPLVGVVAFYYLIGRDGFLPLFLDRVFGLHDLYPEGPLAILLIHTYSFYVFFYAMVGAALAGMDGSQIEAARTLGAKPLRVFVQIVLPMLKPALLGASLLTFMSSGASFSAPLIFGNDFPMLSVRIYEATTQFHERDALTLTVVLALLSGANS